jgi:hypothetical protein
VIIVVVAATAAVVAAATAAADAVGLLLFEVNSYSLKICPKSRGDVRFLTSYG